MKLWWTERAVLDRDAIFDFISADSSRAAVETDERFAKQAGLLTTQPGLGRISRVKGLMELVVGNYILVYQVVDQDIYVIRVLHGAQDWGAWSVKTMHEPLANYGRER
jgi:addiction module toxin, relE/stbE family